MGIDAEVSIKIQLMNRKVDIFLSKQSKWLDEFEALRAIALESGMTEELKWGQPCYTVGKGNVVLIHGFKEYCALLFFKGALMKDAKGILIQQTENVQAGRQIRFTDLKQIVKMKKVLKAYISEAIAIEESGLKVEMKKSAEFEIPEDIQAQLKKTRGLLTAFKKLTPGRQRAYVLHFAAAKQIKTRDSRIEKCAPRILAGKGLND
jgi:uncharacterized protein YdeI (YjbR/CyaY-like superfamily)